MKKMLSRVRSVDGNPIPDLTIPGAKGTQNSSQTKVPQRAQIPSVTKNSRIEEDYIHILTLPNVNRMATIQMMQMLQLLLLPMKCMKIMGLKTRWKLMKINKLRIIPL